MEEYFEDALLDRRFGCGGSRFGISYLPGASDGGGPAKCGSVFFPGCSLSNYALPLVRKAYDILSYAEAVQGITFACCGHSLENAGPDGDGMSGMFAGGLKGRLLDHGVERIVAACPGCYRRLGRFLASDPELSRIEVISLPSVLSSLMHSIDAGCVARGLDACGRPHGAAPKVVMEDACVEMDGDGFARDLRLLMDPASYLEHPYPLEDAVCCGAAEDLSGRCEEADACMRFHLDELREGGGDAFACACANCARHLSFAQDEVPVFHYLELLFGISNEWCEGADAPIHRYF